MTTERLFWVTITKPPVGFGVVVHDGYVVEVGEPMVQFLEGWHWGRAQYHLRRRGGRFVPVPPEELPGGAGKQG